MYEIVHQATYMFFGIDEVYKFVNLLRNLNMNTPEYALSQQQEQKLCVSGETQVDVVVLVVRVVFVCLVVWYV